MLLRLPKLDSVKKAIFKYASFRICKPHRGGGICLEWHERKPYKEISPTIHIYNHHFIRITWQ